MSRGWQTEDSTKPAVPPARRCCIIGFFFSCLGVVGVDGESVLAGLLLGLILMMLIFVCGSVSVLSPISLSIYPSHTIWQILSMKNLTCSSFSFHELVRKIKAQGK